MKSTVYRPLLAAAILGGLATHAPAINTSIPRIGRTPTALSAPTRVPSAAGVVLLPGAMPAVPSLGAAAAVSGAVQSANTASASPLATVQTMAASIQSQPANSQSIMAQAFDGSSLFANGTLRWATPSEVADIQEQMRRATYGYSDDRGYQSYPSQTAKNQNDEFVNLGGRYAIDTRWTPQSQAQVYPFQYGGTPGVAFAADVLRQNGAPWQTIAATNAGAQSYHMDWTRPVQSSSDKLALGMMVALRTFVEMNHGTFAGGNWADDQDYLVGKKLVLKAWYAAFLEYAQSADPLDVSKFFNWVREDMAKSTMVDPAHFYSLLERLTGRYNRPGEANHGQRIQPRPLPISQAAYAAATQIVSGSDGRGHGDDNTVSWLVGFLRSIGEAI